MKIQYFLLGFFILQGLFIKAHLIHTSSKDFTIFSSQLAIFKRTQMLCLR